MSKSKMPISAHEADQTTHRPTKPINPDKAPISLYDISFRPVYRRKPANYRDVLDRFSKLARNRED